MFNKTKRKIVYTVVLSLLSFLIVLLSSIILSNRIAINRQNKEMLQTYVDSYTLENQPLDDESKQSEFQPIKHGEENENPPESPKGEWKMMDEHAFNLSTFYAVAFGENDSVLSIDNGRNDLQSEDELIDLSKKILEEGKSEGKFENFIFIVEQREEYTLVAVIDSTIANNSQQTLIVEMLAIGSIAMLIILLISIYIAKRIIKPLEENDKKQKQFISDAGHELKTPIAVISSNVELLKDDAGSSEWLSNIEYENEKMNSLVHNLLTLSRAENGQVRKEILDFSALVESECIAVESLAFENGKILNSLVESRLIIQANKLQIQQLVSILLDNAISHSSGKYIGIGLRKIKRIAELSVINEAEEMSEDEVKHLFDRFYRVDKARNDDGHHYGLGLSIAKIAAQTNGGDIKAKYIDGKLYMTVTFPIIN